MSIDSLAHVDSLELTAMFHDAILFEEMLSPEELDEYEREMARLADAAEASTREPLPEDFYHVDEPRAYAH